MITTFHKVRHLLLFLVGMGFMATAAHAAAPVIGSLAADSAVVGTPYTYTITTVSNDALVYSVVGTLPAGLTHSAGTISGTPTEAGVFIVDTNAINGDGPGTQSFTLTVTYPVPVITSALTASGRVGDPFSYTIEATNEPTSFSIIGTLYGLLFNTATGELSGTPTANGSGGLLIFATNAAGEDFEVLNLTIDPPLSEPPVITSSRAEAAFVGDSFSYEITATNSPHTGYSTIGTLPAGVTLSGSTLSGTLTEAAVTTFTVVATNAIGVGQADVTLTVTYDAPVVDLSGLPDGRVGDPFDYSIIATNVPTSYAVDGLDSVGGLTFNAATGLISGIPLNAGDFDLIISATNGTGTDTELATLTVLPSLSAAPSITSSLSEQAFAGSFYTYTIVATNAPTSYGLAGVLPAGLERSGAQISGVPTETGVFTVTISASNADGPGEAILELTVVDAPPVVNSPSAVDSSVGSNFTYTITATNSPTSYAVVGLDSIDGLSFDSVTGEIFGIPTVPGDYDLTVTATNSAGSGSADVSVTVIDGVPVITSSLAPSGTVGDAFVYSIVATNTPTSYNVTGLAAVGGLIFDSSTGVISGIPLADGAFDLVISASNANGTDTEPAILTVLPSLSAAPSITSSLSEQAFAGSFYTYTIVATNAPTSYGLAGVLPAGLERSGAQISGVPTETGVFTVTISASNADGTGSKTLVLTVVDAAPVVTSPLTVTSSVGSDFIYTITATNSPTSYAVVGLSSIDGLSFDSVTGVISGIPTVPGDYDLTVTATNMAGSGSADVIVTVIDGVPVITSSLTPSGTVGDAFVYSIEATNTPTSYNVTGLAAVGGLVFDSSTGVISGIPLADGDFDLVISASNANGTDTELAVLTVLPSSSAAPAITSSLTESALSGSFYAYTIVATNAPTSYGLTGILPTGLTRNGDLISGVPTEVGVFNVTILASNASGTGEETLELTVQEALPVINSPSSAFGTVDSEFNYMITATGSPTSFAVVGLDSIAGLTFDSGTGVISGIPTVEVDTDLVVTATNGSGSDSQAVRLLIGPAEPGTGNVPPTVEITSPLTGATLDGTTTEITIEADVTPSAGETIDTVFVRWTNPPANTNTPEIILLTMTAGATVGTTTSYTGTVTLGFNPNDRELGAGDIDLEVVAFQTNAVNAQDYGSDQVDFTIKPIMEFLFPEEAFAMDSILIDDVFASVRLSTNLFTSITARIAGSSIVDTLVDLDESDNSNGVFNFLATKIIDFPGFYDIRITALDSSGNTTILERRILISDSLAQPVAILTAPTPGFTNEVFSAAVLSYATTGREAVTVANVGVVGFNVTYALDLISGGQGYYPRNASNVSILATDETNLTVGVPGVTVSNGRVTELPDDFTIFYLLGAPEWNVSGNAILDDLSDPGRNGWISIAGQFFKANAELSSYKLYVNGEDVTPGTGNLDPLNGTIDVPVTLYPGAGRGSPAPGDYIAYAQVTDRQGEVGTSEPLAFTIVAYEPLEITLTGPASEEVEQGTAVEFHVAVTPYTSVKTVEFFDSDSGDSLGFAGQVEIDGEELYRFTQSFNQQGDFGLYTIATGFNGQTVRSDPIRINVTPLNDLEVAFTDPLVDQAVIVGQSLSFEVEATATPGVTSVTFIVDNEEVFVDDSAPFQHSVLFDGVGPSLVFASAVDGFGNTAATETIIVTATGSDVAVTITSTLEDDSVVIGQTQTFSTTTVATVGIASVEWYVNDVLTETATASPFDFTYLFSRSGTTNLRAEAFDALGNSASDSTAITVNLANPLLRDGDFVSYAYLQLTGSYPTTQQLDDALDQMDGTIGGRVAFLEALFESDEMEETLEVMLIYRTMTGEWPDATELAAARAGLFGGTAGAGSQSGSIELGGTQTFEFTYGAGDNVTVRVTADASEGNPLTDSTLTINNPSGAVVAFSDDSFFSLDPLVNFTATAAGTYTAIVGGFFNFQEGDFTITSTSSNSGGTSNASAEALVQSLIPEFEARFDRTFPISSVTSPAEATSLVEQLFKNKHGRAPEALSWNRLQVALTGSGQTLGGLSVPGYTGNLSAFTAAFALDNELSQYSGLTSVHYYQIPNQPINDVPLALMIAMFLGEDPTDQALAAYAGMTQAQAFEAILTDPLYYEQFPPSSVESFVSLKLADLGVFDQSLNGPADDADDDGVLNLMEIALGSDPSDPSDTIEPMATDMEGTEFVITFIRIKASEVPGDFIISLECAVTMTEPIWDTASDIASVASTVDVMQDGVPEGYERVEIRIDTMERDCGFFRLSVDLP